MENFMFLAPEIAVVATGLIILLIGVFMSPRAKNVLGYLATLGILAALALTIESFGDMEATDVSRVLSVLMPSPSSSNWSSWQFP